MKKIFATVFALIFFCAITDNLIIAGKQFDGNILYDDNDKAK